MLFLALALLPPAALGLWLADGRDALLVAAVYAASLLAASGGACLWLLRPLARLQARTREAALGRGQRLAPGDVSPLFTPLARHIDYLAASHGSRQASALADKTVLLQEVHHRVKNNLQLIISILNMQIRDASREGDTAMLRQVRGRVLSLAVVYKNLYQAPSVASVRADRLLPDILGQIVDGKERRVAIETAIDALALHPDQAVPLALIVTEAGLAAADTNDDMDETARLSVTLLEQARDQLALTIACPNPAADGEIGIDDLGARLMTAFAAQLGGRLEREREAGDLVLRLAFERRPPPTLDPAAPAGG